MKWTDELVLKFAWFHSRRMQNAFQTDGEFYVLQSMQIFVQYNGDIDNFKFFL